MVRACSHQPLFVGLAASVLLRGVQMGWRDGQREKALIRPAPPGPLHGFHIRHRIPHVGNGRPLGAEGLPMEGGKLPS